MGVLVSIHRHGASASRGEIRATGRWSIDRLWGLIDRRTSSSILMLRIRETGGLRGLEISVGMLRKLKIRASRNTRLSGTCEQISVHQSNNIGKERRKNSPEWDGKR
jgi:hypothetical protein